jgi:hypothetical protein
MRVLLVLGVLQARLIPWEAPAQAVAEPPAAMPPPAVAEPPLLHEAPYTPYENRRERLDTYYDLIKERPYRFQQVGSIIQALARADFEWRYPPPAYEVLRNLEYQEGSRTLGELDLVVYRRDTTQAVVVAEAKLSGNLKGAAKRAERQLMRFQDALRKGRITRFLCNDDRDRSFGTSHFGEHTSFFRIGNRGALEAGFDFEVDLTREEADDLQERLLRGAAGTRGDPPEKESGDPAGPTSAITPGAMACCGPLKVYGR